MKTFSIPARYYHRFLHWHRITLHFSRRRPWVTGHYGGHCMCEINAILDEL